MADDVILQRVQDLDARYQKQVNNQVESINRLLADPDSVKEIARLNEQLASAQQRIAELEAGRA